MLEKIVDGRTDLVFEYLAQGHSAQSKDKHGTSLIQWCAYYGDISAMRFLLSEGESLSCLGENLDLHGAAFHGHWQLCQYLIEKGVDVNFRQADSGETPLHACLSKANRPVYEFIVNILLDAGADPNVQTIQGTETGSFMRDCRNKGETPLHRAAAFADEEVIQSLIKAGAAVEMTDGHGDTPLSWASWHLRPPSILRLLCYGEYAIHPDNTSTYDHGRGWSQIDPPVGKVHTP